ncbi:MAG: NERD domain-containing protein [Anaerolineae bacterium]|nr:NERD domain-containing protein [Anaerolineae bacterium]
MRVATNHTKIRRNRRIAQYAFFATLALLILGLFVTNAAPNNPLLLLAPLVVLPVAIAATFYSVRMANLWLREPRPEKTLDEGLKGLSTRAVLYNYVLPARHVLITPQGVFTFTMRPQEGDFVVENNKWVKKGNAFSKFMTLFRQDTLGRPDLDAQREAAEVQKLVDQVAPDSGVVVEPVIVFSNPYATVEVIESPYPVLYANPKQKPNLKTFTRDLKKREDPASLTDEQIAALEKAVEYVPEETA